MITKSKTLTIEYEHHLEQLKDKIEVRSISIKVGGGSLFDEKEIEEIINLLEKVNKKQKII